MRDLLFEMLLVFFLLSGFCLLRFFCSFLGFGVVGGFLTAFGNFHIVPFLEIGIFCFGFVWPDLSHNNAKSYCIVV